MTPAQVNNIRGLALLGLSCGQIASRFGVTRMNVWLIINERAWTRAAQKDLYAKLPDPLDEPPGKVDPVADDKE